MADEQIKFKIGLDDSGVNQAIGKLEGKFLGLATKLGVALGGVFAFKKIVSAAIDSENSVNRLNVALASAGRFSQTASNAFQSLASEIQKTTTLSDDAVLSSAALASNFTKTNTQAEALTKAAIQLSAATGKDLNTSVESLGRSLTGSGIALRQIGIDTKMFTAEQLKAGAAVDFVNKRFAGSAEGAVKTFGGALQNTSNRFGDLIKNIGFIITKSEPLRQVVLAIGKAFDVLTIKVQEIAASGFFDALVKNLVSLGPTLVRFLVLPLELAVQAIGGVLSGFSKIAGFLHSVASTLFPELKDAAVGLGLTIGELFNTPFSDSLIEGFKNLSFEIAKSSKTSTDFKNNVLSNFQETASEVSELTKNLGGTVKSSSLQLVSAAAQGVGAILSGNVSALEALGGTLRNILGDMLIKAGEAIVLQSTAFKTFQAAILGLFPAAGIGAGLLLIAAGAAIKGAAQSIASPSIGSGAAPPISTPTSVSETERRATEVNINVEGTVLSPRDVGIQIAEILQEAFDANDSKVIARA